MTKELKHKMKTKKKIMAIISIMLVSSMLTGCGMGGILPNMLDKLGSDGEETVAEDNGGTGTEDAAEQEPENTGETVDGALDLMPSDDQGLNPGFKAGSKDGSTEADTPPEIIVRKKYYYESSDDENYAKLLSGHLQIPLLSDESAVLYPDLAIALEKDADTALESYDGLVEQCTEEVKEWYSQSEADDWFMSYELTRDVIVKRADAKVVSMFLYYTQYSGGAHGIYGNYGLNYDSQTGRSLTLSDVLASPDDLDALVREEINIKYADDMDMFFDLDESLSHYSPYEVSEDQDYSDDDYKVPYVWALDHEGLLIYFGPYELAAYAAGAQTVTLKYSDHPELFKPEYMPDSQDVGYIEYFDRYSIDFDVDGDGKNDSIGLDNMYDEGDYEYATGLSVSVNEETMEVPEECDLAFPEDAKGYFVHEAGGRNLIYVIVSSYNDFIDLIAFDVSDAHIEYLGIQTTPSFYIDYDEKTECNREFLLYDPDHMHFAKRFDFICTVNGFRSFHIAQNGLPTTSDEVYTIYKSGGWEPVKCAKSFEAECIDDETNPEKITINAGETFELVATDGESWLDVVLSDGRKVRLYIEGMGNDLKVNGQPAEELFTQLMYAG